MTHQDKRIHYTAYPLIRSFRSARLRAISNYIAAEVLASTNRDSHRLKWVWIALKLGSLDVNRLDLPQ